MARGSVPADAASIDVRTVRDPRLIRGVAVLALVVTTGYLIWRAGWTLDGAALWIALPFLAVEIHNAIGLGVFTLALWDVGPAPRPRPAQTARRVAVLIPTYDEPALVLLPTITAAVALEPAHETWVLDDGNRPEVRDLAERLGACYLTREGNQHAKAGNLNNALGVVDAEIVAILDSDHVPLPGFLAHTLGYFDDETVAVVQTPQDFYNTDSFEHDHRDGAEFSEQAIFYRAIGPGKNHWQGAFWCGTCALLRTSALKSVGGVAVGTLTEDIQTTIRLQRRGWNTVYHDEVLARGLASSDAAGYMLQRRRWATGAMQVLRRERPLTASGLHFGQRLAYAATLFAWFDSWRTLAYQLLPVAILLTGCLPVAAPLNVFGTLALTVFVLQFVALRLLARGLYPPVLSLIFEMLRLPAVLPATLALLTPDRPRRFRVTPKGRRDEPQGAPVPTIYPALLALGGFAVAWMVATLAGLTPVHYDHPGAVIGASLFLAGNQLLVIAAVRRIRNPAFRGERRASYRFPTELAGRLDGTRCTVSDLSLSGARVFPWGPIAAPRAGDPATLEIDLPRGAQRFRSTIRRHLPDGSIGIEFMDDGAAQMAGLALAIHHAPAAGAKQLAA